MHNIYMSNGELHADEQANMPLSPVRVELPSSPSPQQVAQASFDIIPPTLRYEEYYRYGPGQDKQVYAFKMHPTMIHSDRLDAVLAMAKTARFFKAAGLDPHIPIDAAVALASPLPTEIKHDTHEDRRSYYRADAFSAIAKAYAEIGETTKAQEIINGRHPAWENPEDKKKMYIGSEVYRTMAEMYAQEGKHSEAIQILRDHLAPANLRTAPKEAAHLASVERKYGFVDEARETEAMIDEYIDEITGSRMGVGQSPLFVAMAAKEQFEVGQEEVAAVTLHKELVRMVESIEKEGSVADYEMGTVVEYGNACAGYGLIEDAEIVKGLIDKYHKKDYRRRMTDEELEQEKQSLKSTIDLELAKRYAKMGDFEKADAILGQVAMATDPVLEAQSVVLALKGNADEAIAIAVNLSYSGARKVALEPMIEQFARQGNIQAALDIVDNKLTDKDFIDSVHKTVAQAHVLTLAKKYQEALQRLQQTEIKNISQADIVSQELCNITQGMLLELA